MESLKIEATEDAPAVNFDFESGSMMLSGESRPENASKFYAPVIKWITDIESALQANKQKKLSFAFKLDYFNSISAKYIMDIMLILKKYVDNGNTVKIEWHYDKRDDDMLDAGKEYGDAAGITIDFMEF